MRKKRSLSPESVYSRTALEQWLDEDLNMTREHIGRIWKHGSLEARDLPQRLVQEFPSRFSFSTSQIVQEKQGEHGRKLVIRLQDGQLIETVLIQKASRTTVCVSSQVGCQMGCTFCATGLMGRLGQLKAAEIVEQVAHARSRDANVSGVVFMGMGEPLDNLEEVIEAIKTLTNPHALGGKPIGLKHITLSTVGVVHGIKRLARDCPQIQLALSLHAPNDEIRQRIVPTSKAFTMPKIMAAVEEYQKAGKKSVMMEYIMIDRVNSSPECAHELGKLLEGRKCMVNLIPYNPTEAGDRFGFQAPTEEVCEQFSKILYQYKNDKGKPMRCSIRYSSSRGQDIDAACGQLALKNLGAGEASSSSCSGDMEDMVASRKTGRTRLNKPRGDRKDKKDPRSAKGNKAKDHPSESKSYLVSRQKYALMGVGALVASAVVVWSRTKKR